MLIIWRSENIAKDFPFVTREAVDAYAAVSHSSALAAMDQGRFLDEIVPIRAVKVDSLTKESTEFVMSKDDEPRRGTTAATLAKLRCVLFAAGSFPHSESLLTNRVFQAGIPTLGRCVYCRKLVPDHGRGGGAAVDDPREGENPRTSGYGNVCRPEHGRSASACHGHRSFRRGSKTFGPSRDPGGRCRSV